MPTGRGTGPPDPQKKQLARADQTDTRGQKFRELHALERPLSRNAASSRRAGRPQFRTRRPRRVRTPQGHGHADGRHLGTLRPRPLARGTVRRGTPRPSCPPRRAAPRPRAPHHLRQRRLHVGLRPTPVRRARGGGHARARRAQPAAPHGPGPPQRHPTYGQVPQGPGLQFLHGDLHARGHRRPGRGSGRPRLRHRCHRPRRSGGASPCQRAPPPRDGRHPPAVPAPAGPRTARRPAHRRHLPAGRHGRRGRRRLVRRHHPGNAAAPRSSSAT